MKSRCYRKGYHNYDRYGARGIVVCERWKDSFPKFLEDMGPKPSADHSLDRIDNDGNYEPGNCRWATAKEQSNNRECTRWLEAFGEKKTLIDWLKDSRCIVNECQLRGRLVLGIPDEEAITRPIRPKFVKIEAFGEAKMICEWAKDSRCTVSKASLRDRLERGMEPELAIAQPPTQRSGSLLVIKKKEPSNA